jgi:Fe2+ transport system protein FeoA
MLGKAELEKLRLQKDLLVLQSDANRLVLTTELQRLRSLGFWQGEASQVARKHPLLTAVLGVKVGVLAIKAMRQPGVAMSWLSRLGGAGSTLLSVWNLMGRK